MCRRRVEPLHIIERERRIDQESEEAGADQIPDQHGREKHERPVVGLLPVEQPLVFGAAVSLEADDHQRHHFERREHAAERDHSDRRSAEIEMVERAEDAAAEEDNGCDQDRRRRDRNPHQAHADEKG